MVAQDFRKVTTTIRDSHLFIAGISIEIDTPSNRPTNAIAADLTTLIRQSRTQTSLIGLDWNNPDDMQDLLLQFIFHQTKRLLNRAILRYQQGKDLKKVHLRLLRHHGTTTLREQAGNSIDLLSVLSTNKCVTSIIRLEFNMVLCQQQELIKTMAFQITEK